MKKLIALALVLVLCLSVFAGCGSKDTASGESGGSDEVITLTVFDKNSGSKTFTDPVAQKIMEDLNIKIQVENPTGDPSEKLNLMLSGQNYPDIVLIGQGEIVTRYIEAGALIPLDDLIAEYGPDVVEMYGETMNKTKHTDGKNYWLANWYGVEPDASAGVLMRKDLLAEIVGEERANSPEPFTQSEYIDILKQFKEKFPTIDGKETVALTLNADAKNYVGTMRGMFGMKSYYQTADGLEHEVKNPAYKEAMLFLNGLYTDGLLDKEWVINKTEQWEQKLSSGIVFSTWNSYWDTDGVNSTLAATVGEDAQFFCYKVVADSISADQTTYNGRSTLGWDAIGITDNCKNPEAAMKLMNYLASEEGQYLLLWGLEGEHWTIENGVHVPREDLYNGLKNEFDKTSNDTGVRKWTWFIKNGYGSDGTPYDLTTKYVLTPTAEFANKVFGASDRWDTADFANLEPAGSTPLGLKWQKINDVYTQYYSKVINAANADEAASVFDAMVAEMENAGLAECEEYISEQYDARMDLWYN